MLFKGLLEFTGSSGSSGHLSRKVGKEWIEVYTKMWYNVRVKDWADAWSFLCCTEEATDEDGGFLRRTERQVIALLENPKWEAFCLHYARTGNASEAYRNAGYTAATERSIYANCNRLLKKDVSKARRREIGEELAADKIAGIREIQERLTAILRGELLEEQIVVEGLGEGMSQARIATRAPQLKDVIKAGETLGRMQGAFDNKLQVEMTVPVFGGEDDLTD